MAAFRNGVGIGQSFRIFRELGQHLLITLAIIISAAKLHPVRVVHGLIGLDTQQHVLGRRIFPVHVVDIVGHYQLQVVFHRQAPQLRIHNLFFRQVVVLHLQEKVLFPKNFQILLHGCFRPGHIPLQNMHGNLPGHTGAQTDDAFVVTAQQFLIDAGLAIKAFQIAPGHQLHQILVAGIIFRQQDQMIPVAAFILTVAVRRSQIHFAADNGPHALLLCFLVKLHGAVHVAVVGHGDAVHAQGFGITDQLRRFGRTVQQAELGMDMQMGKITSHGNLSFFISIRSCPARSTVSSSAGTSCSLNYL